MLARKLISRLRIAMACTAAIAICISASQQNWSTVMWAASTILLALDGAWLERRAVRASTNRCTQCGRHRIGGGVFVAGVGPICFECEERKFGPVEFGGPEL